MQDRRLAGSGLPVSVFIRVSANLHTSVRPAQNSAQDHTKCLLMARSKPFLVLGLTWSLKFLQRWYVGRDKNKRSRFPAVTPLSAQFFFEHPPIVAISIDQTHTFSFVSQRNFARFRKKILPSQILDSQPSIFLAITRKVQRNRYGFSKIAILLVLKFRFKIFKSSRRGLVKWRNFRFDRKESNLMI